MHPWLLGQFRVVLRDECSSSFHDQANMLVDIQQQRGDPILATLCIREGVKEVCGRITKLDPKLFHLWQLFPLHLPPIWFIT
jgi:hypothetical protein